MSTSTFSHGGRWRPASLSTHAKVALNRQIARDLSDRIQAGDLPSGASLPSEAELAETYGVNRLTVRHALSDLARQGLITLAKGRRTTVAVPPVRYRLDQKAGASLTSAMHEQGLAVIHVPSRTERVDATDAPLPLGPYRRCVRVDYQRWVDGQVWSRSSTWLPRELAPTGWAGEEPLLDSVASTHNLHIRRAIRSFAAVPATLDDADALDVPVGAALLRVTGTSVEQDGRTIAVVRHHVLGDRAEYVVNLLD